MSGIATAKIAKTFLEFLKLAPRYFAAFGIIAALLLFGKESILKYIGVYDFAQNNREYIGLVFIIFTILFIIDMIALLIVSWGGPIITIIRYKMLIAKTKKTILQRLNCLTEEEKQILRFYIFNETKTNILRIDDGVVKGLIATSVIFRSADYSVDSLGFAHNITDFAWDYLHHHNILLAGNTDIRRTDKLPDDGW